MFSVKYTDASSSRWEVPRMYESEAAEADSHITIDITDSPFCFVVKNGHNRVLDTCYNTVEDSLLFYDEHIRLTTHLTDEETLYGLGQRNFDLALEKGIAYRLLASDADGCTFNPQRSCYGTHPIAFVASNSQHRAILFRNSNAAQANYTDDDRLIWESSGGILHFDVFFANSFFEVTELYRNKVSTGKTPDALPFWLLGWQQSRWGYNSLDDVKRMVNTYKKLRMPLDVVYFDIDLFDEYKDFTLGPSFPREATQAFIADLQSRNIKIAVIVDPGLAINNTYSPYTELKDSGLYLKKPDGSPFIGSVWPGDVLFPSFSGDTSIIDVWAKMLDDWHKLFAYDLLWTDMNEVSSRTHMDKTCPAVYKPGDRDCPMFIPENTPSLAQHTVSMNVTDTDGTTMFNLRNLYGREENRVTRAALNKILPDQRVPTITRSSFPGSGRSTYAWLGDNFASELSLRATIGQHQAHQLFGIDVTGADLSGYHGLSSVDLNCRWMELGTFLTFSRNHKAKAFPFQPPYYNGLVKDVSIAAINLKYELSRVMYSHLMLRKGLTMQPLVYHWDSIADYRRVSDQFVFCDSIMVCPVVVENATTKECLLPKEESWFEFRTGFAVASGRNTYPAPHGYVNMFLRDGAIMPLHSPRLTITEAGETDVTLVVVRPVMRDNVRFEAFFDDGLSRDLNANITSTFINTPKGFSYEVTNKNYELNTHVATVRVTNVRDNTYLCIGTNTIHPTSSIHGGFLEYQLDMPLTEDFEVLYC
ncbi:hypothetical protein PCE1_004320 [Barthelona sp. PCE]